MNEKEKKAIEYCNNKINKWKENRPRNAFIFNGIVDEIDSEDIKAMNECIVIENNRTAIVRLQKAVKQLNKEIKSIKEK